METLDLIYRYVWGLPLLVLLVMTGLYLTWVLRGIQIRCLGMGLRLILFPPKEEGGKGDISHFQSLMTALAATLGIGNIAGVATAITVGGLGSLFWLWMIAFIGMATKYSEALMAVRYRQTDHRGEMCGGPMYFIEKGLGWRSLAILFAAAGTLSAFGGGNMIQANTVADAMWAHFEILPWVSGAVMCVLTLITLIGGIKSIGRVASIVVPFMAFFYLMGGIVIMVMKADMIPQAAYTILMSAFEGQAAIGGFAGATISVALQTGVARGLMTSEAGLGTGSIAAAAAKTSEPGRQALISMAGTFLGTFVMCTVTGYVLALTGVLGIEGADGRLLNGAPMTVAAFDSALPGSGIFVVVGIVLFAYTTILGWAYYGEKCVEYLVGERWIIPFRVLFSLAIIPGAMLDLHVVWRLADIANGLMAYPNVFALLLLSPVIVKETERFLGQSNYQAALSSA